jgi:hypothetical protein
MGLTIREVCLMIVPTGTLRVKPSCLAALEIKW